MWTRSRRRSVPRHGWWISEAPTNPYQTVPDLRRVAKLVRERRKQRQKIYSMIDSTFATPINLRPCEYGIDLVVHSATKYMAGHNDVLGGVVAGNEGLVSLVRDLRHVFGANLDPHAAYLIHRGMKTLALRVAQQNASALKIARWLEEHERVKQVWYAGLPSHSCHEVAKELMSGFGGVVTFELDMTLEQGSKVIDACEIPRIAPSLGGVESLIEQPALMSFLRAHDRAAGGHRDSRQPRTLRRGDRGSRRPDRGSRAGRSSEAEASARSVG